MQILISNEQANNRTLCGSLRRRDRMCLGVHRHAAGSLPQQFLHDLDVYARSPQESRVGVPEGVPPNSLRNPDATCGGLNVASHQWLTTVGFAAPRMGLANSQSSGPRNRVRRDRVRLRARVKGYAIRHSG